MELDTFLVFLSIGIGGILITGGLIFLLQGNEDIEERMKNYALYENLPSVDLDQQVGKFNINRFRIRINTVLGALYSGAIDQIFVPLSTAQDRLFGVDHVSSILAQMGRDQDLEAALFDIETLLRRSHRLGPDADNDFRVRRQDLFLSTIQDTNEEMSRFILLIALISLFVGGLGIANVMLVSVTERTREIGIRRALGANRFHILSQFLIEAVVLGLAGGLFGVAGGTAFSRMVIGAEASTSWLWVGYSFVICSGIGMVAGMYPATQAAYRNILDALRHE